MRLPLLSLITTLTLLISPTSATQAQTQPGCPDNATPAVLRVTTDYLPATTPPTAFIENNLNIRLCGIQTFLNNAAAIGNQTRNQLGNVHLYINGLDAGISPTSIDSHAGTITFNLVRTADNSNVWRPILYSPFLQRTVTFHVSIGIDGQAPLPRVTGANLEVNFHKLLFDWITIAFLLLVAVVIAVTVSLGMHTDILRDGPALASIRQPYSLGKVQMALWFLLIITSYVLIWLVDGDQRSIPESLLMLMGISGATGIASVVTTPSSTSRVQSVVQRLTSQKTALDQSLHSLETQLTSTKGTSSNVLQAQQSSHQVARDKIARQLATQPPVIASRGFWKDLFSDDLGTVALDRLQIIAWTAVMCFLFIYDVLFYLVMPQFDPTLVLLMGISSGTYIGFKLPHDK